MIKKSILIFIALSFFSVCFAGSIQDFHKAAIARKNACTTPQAPVEDGGSEGEEDVAKFAVAKYRATKFTYGGTTGKAICKITVLVSSAGLGSDPHSYYVAIWGHDAGNDEPDYDNILGTSDSQDLMSLSTDETAVDFEFSSPTSTLTNATVYWVLLYSSTDDEDDYAEWFYDSDTAGTEFAGYAGTVDGSWTTSIGHTKKFKLWSQ